MNILYRGLFSNVVTHNHFKKCIICFAPHDDTSKDKILTDEHIVPEFIGGRIVVKNVCKECNSTLGYSLEGPLSNNIYFKLYAYNNGIKGKKHKLTNPLAGLYTYHGVRFRFEEDFTLYQLPVIDSQPTEDGGFKLGVSIDKKDLKTIEKDIFKAVSRKLKKSGRILKEDKLKEDIRKVIDNSKDNIQVLNQPEIKVTFSLDYDQIGLLALKIIYELVAWLNGEDFISSNEFNLMRLSLKKLKLHKKFKYVNKNFFKIFKELLEINPYHKIKDYSYINSVFSDNKTIVLFMSGFCSVRLLNIWFSFMMPKALKNAFLIFTSDSKTGDFNFYGEDIFLSNSKEF